MRNKLGNIGVVGFGEAGGILAAAFASLGCRVSAFDILSRDANAKPLLQAKADKAGVSLCRMLADATTGADLVVSAVTASSARAVADDCRSFLTAGQYFLDINSVSPHAKQENAAKIESSGAFYVEAAVMAPVPPQGLKVPMLLGGARANELSELLQAFGMNTRVVANEIGVASAIKMCRSIVIKGLEALAVESLFAARRYQAEDAVLASLQASFPNMGWAGEFPDYLISRVAEHGRRRAAELREVAATLEEVGVEPTMALATAKRHDDLIDAMQARDCQYDPSEAFSWRALADKLNDSRK